MSIASMIDLSTEYHFADFTRAEYRAMLQLAKRHYVFRSFATADPAERFVIWRHDVDYSMSGALALARIEASEDVRATYCLRLHSEMYNLLEAPMLAMAREIVALGHDIGLHLDTESFAIHSESTLDELVAWESSILARLLGQPVVAVSYHQPTPFLLGCRRERYGGLLNAYAAQYQTTVGYVSDSNGYWRHRRLRDVLEQATDFNLQVLTHPVWWTDEVLSPAARIEACITERAEAMRTYYRDDMQRAGRLNVGAT